jgi:nitric oxide reductase large subunit
VRNFASTATSLTRGRRSASSSAWSPCSSCSRRWRGGLAHYRVESGAFFGIDLARLFPYNLLRTFHLQLAIFWIATAWVAGGLFLAPIVGGAEPRGQRAGVLALLVVLAVVVFGSLGGEWLGINNRLADLWLWLGYQGSEYLDLGRFWQLLLAVGLAGWLVLMYRALRPRSRSCSSARARVEKPPRDGWETAAARNKDIPPP